MKWPHKFYNFNKDCNLPRMKLPDYKKDCNCKKKRPTKDCNCKRNKSNNYTH